ncbi:protein-L-isoaspartate methyltransferase [Thermoplasma volcanium GSS1]|uniref:Protein-L-isoaspartate methyltransferase n=1 Tax=Thermoplasma volcanium (strain ATCC 51530 / DSM 4299 / JCM 9571 / NBRC 15438 / GSS1) TaxID=273116 RepID=Q97A26_THEVO|nr:tRNA (adenine-N1)-methyltransferase [Thermoplasma volcanium]BAB60126.1 protein-L-isoaspartate methyltransferase [Thermoplasma volcanium GSS1]
MAYPLIDQAYRNISLAIVICTFMILTSSDEDCTLENKTVNCKNKKIFIPPNFVASPGDLISVDGQPFIVAKFMPFNYGRLIKRRTQIISPADAAYIIMRTGLGIGMKAMEIGVGSGNLSAYILWAIGKEGHLTLVDREMESIQFSLNNLSKFYDLENVDYVIGDPSSLKVNNDYDALFVDIPNPWNYLENLKMVLKPGSMAEFYLPNFDQVEKTVLGLEEHGFVHLETAEIQRRRLIVRKDATRPASDDLTHSAYMVFSIFTSGLKASLKP